MIKTIWRDKCFDCLHFKIFKNPLDCPFIKSAIKQGYTKINCRFYITKSFREDWIIIEHN
ncbi:MAG: hypothetical protein NC827_05875 [Candidatus Omnitrophica bacterium]|nr:hypothetical protein [Candidatus Omnitrophota bacterium]